MKTLKKVTRVLFFIGCFLFTALIFAQTPMGAVEDGEKVVVRKIGGLEEYSSSLDLNDNRKQLLMAGQNYQTNYGIYASIEIGESSLGSNYKTLENISFEIVNYKPTYFIGIDSIVVASSLRKDGLTFKIYTRAMSDQKTLTLGKEALNHIHFEQGSYLHSERYLNPMFPEKDANGKVVFMEDGRVASQPDNGKAFDFEFFYKDGRHVVRKENYDKEEEKPQTFMNEVASTLPGKRCSTSFNKIMF